MNLLGSGRISVDTTLERAVPLKNLSWISPMLDCEELFFPLTTTSFRHVKALELKGYEEAFIHVKNIPFFFF